jgi:hypothetical protein
MSEETKKEEAKEEKKELTLSQQRRADFLLATFTQSNTNWKTKFRGYPSGKPKPQRFWYNGELISKEEHDKLSHAEILEYNNQIGKGHK